jgi:polysaccharide export outer membrane protein
MVLRQKRALSAILSISLSAALLALFGSSGCANARYRASQLPVEYIAPSSPNLEKIDLGGLANHSVSLEVIQPGDVLEVTMITDYVKLVTTASPLRVGDDGAIVVPLVGKVGVAGLSAEQAEQTIASESIRRGVFRTPCFTVTMKQCRTNKVTVVGAVNKPGTHDLPRGSSSLLAALVASEGLAKDASADVEIRHTDRRPLASADSPDRPSAEANAPGLNAGLVAYEAEPPELLTTKVNLVAATSGRQKTPSLRDGDIVYVAKRTLPAIYVLGLVGKPGELPFPPNQELRVLDALAMAGGCSSPVADKVLVIRRLPNREEPVQIAVSIQAAKSGHDNIALAPGDTVMVEQTPETFVLDIIKNFLHFSFGTKPVF